MYFLFLFSHSLCFCCVWIYRITYLSLPQVTYGQIAVCLGFGLYAGRFEPLSLVFVMSLCFVMWVWVGVTSSNFIVKLSWKEFYFIVFPAPGTSEVLISPQMARVNAEGSSRSEGVDALHATQSEMQSRLWVQGGRCILPRAEVPSFCT